MSIVHGKAFEIKRMWKQGVDLAAEACEEYQVEPRISWRGLVFTLKRRRVVSAARMGLRVGNLVDWDWVTKESVSFGVGRKGELKYLAADPRRRRCRRLRHRLHTQGVQRPSGTQTRPCT